MAPFVQTGGWADCDRIDAKGFEIAARRKLKVNVFAHKDEHHDLLDDDTCVHVHRASFEKRNIETGGG